MLPLTLKADRPVRSPSRLIRGRALVCAAMAAGVVSGATDAAAAEPRPALSVPSSALRAALACSGPRAPKQHPVLLVPGTGSNARIDWSVGLQKLLLAQGRTVCTIDLPESALGEIQVAAEYVVASVRTESRHYGRHIDVIGHSQGGMLPRWALKWWPDVRTYVADVIGLSPSNHGSPLATPLCAGPCAPGVREQEPGSSFLNTLNRGDETPGRVSYTTIGSTTDTTVPFQFAAVRGGSEDTNVAVQQICPGRKVSHTGMLYDAVAIALVEDALHHSGPARASRIPRTVCDRTLAKGLDAGQVAAEQAQGNAHFGQVLGQAPKVSADPPLRVYTRAAAPAPKAVLSVSPARAPLGVLTTVRVRALGAWHGQRWPLLDARVTLAGRVAHTNRAGVATFRLRIGAIGRSRLTLTETGLDPARSDLLLVRR
jgi:triacylglycerol esterase/lipase EstA (alpha/beta hydrolase family)